MCYPNVLCWVVLVLGGELVMALEVAGMAYVAWSFAAQLAVEGQRACRQLRKNGEFKFRC